MPECRLFTRVRSGGVSNFVSELYLQPLGSITDGGSAELNVSALNKSGDEGGIQVAVLIDQKRRM
jgi:hypothetical protein